MLHKSKCFLEVLKLGKLGFFIILLQLKTNNNKRLQNPMFTLVMVKHL